MAQFDSFADFRVDGHVTLVTGDAQNIGEATAWDVQSDPHPMLSVDAFEHLFTQKWEPVLRPML
ncbi:hypothetical protein [Microvirga sp. M2]|uniref:hypothetical protein n=1 Tax=Microvirga sp. M2 TaxID=3073270 RepID=UPI0039C44876